MAYRSKKTFKENAGGGAVSKPIRDKKGHYRKYIDSIDEELKTLKGIVELFQKLEFKESHRWVIWWLQKKYL